jgi:hypothetical protein
MAAGAAAAIGPLRRRAAWDRANRTVAIALDYDDVAEVATRASQSLPNLLHALWHAGATHLAIPEDTLGRLMAQGRIGAAIPRAPLGETSSRWSYLAAHEAGLLDRVQTELAARQPGMGIRQIDDDGRSLLAVDGDLQALLPLGLGFDAELAHAAVHAGLAPLPRPTSYPWPTPGTIDRSLGQAAALARPEPSGPAIVAFQGIGTPGHPGELILGHEMLIQDTIASMKRHGLAFAYFVESRHQRGDWFVAKSLAPAVVLAHQFDQAQLVPEDMGSAAHRWGLLAREKGIRLALLSFFKVVHATAALDCVDYVAAMADVLVNREGMRLHGRPDFRPAHVHHHHDHGHGHDHAHHHHEERGVGSGEDPHDPAHGDDETPHRHLGNQYGNHAHAHDTSALSHSQFAISNSQLLRDDRALPFLALIPTGAGALAVSELLDLPDAIAVPLTLAGLAAPLLVRQLDRPANALEAAFRPSYAPKLIALGAMALAPLAASLVGYRGGLAGLLAAIAVEGLAAVGLAAAVADQDYTLRIEEVKATQLGWIVPVAGALAVTLAPLANNATTRRRQDLPVQVEIVEAPAIKTRPVVRLAKPAGLAGRSLAGPSKVWAQRMALTTAEKALAATINQGSGLLRRRLPGITGAAAVWAFRQGGALAQRKLLERAAVVLALAASDQSVDSSDLCDELTPALPSSRAVLARPAAALPAPREPQVLAWRLGLLAAGVGAGLVLTKAGLLPPDPFAALDVEHRAEHTHHLSRAQAAIGDASMALSPQPLRKWTVPTVAAQAVAALAPGPSAGVAAVAAALGEIAFLAGFRQAARPLGRTVTDRLSLLRMR